MIDLFVDNALERYLDTARTVFGQHGSICFSSRFGYSQFDPSVYNIESECEVDEVPITKSVNIDYSTSNLVLENAPEIDSELVSYLADKGIQYSSIVNLRSCVTDGTFRETMWGVNAVGKINLYLKTTALDLEQIEAMLPKLVGCCASINVMTDDKAAELLDKYAKQYPNVKFQRITT